MTDRQDQRLEGSGTAIQANRDVVIGMPTEQVVTLVRSTLETMSTMVMDARSQVEARLSEFRREMEDLFVSGRARPEALKEPDFQHVLQDAQTSYARVGGDSTREALADIIAARSKAAEGTREAYTLNVAVQKAAIMTFQEYNVLTFIYIIRHTKNTIVDDCKKFDDYVNEWIVPLIDNIATHESACQFLEAQGVARRSMGEVTLRPLLLSNYSGLLGKGFSYSDMKHHVSGDLSNLNSVLVVCGRNNAHVQPNAISRELFLESNSNNMSSQQLNEIWNLYDNSIPDDDGMIEMLRHSVPRIDDIFRIWNKTFVKNLELNSVGIALGHANALRLTPLEAPLNIWIN